MIKKRNPLLQIILLVISINLLLINIYTYNINKRVELKGYGYYIGKIESMNQKDGITKMEVSPTSSNREFISEIKANHQIEYPTNLVNVAGIKDPKSKNYKRLKMGELSKMVKNIKVGDSIIFKIKDNDYDEDKYNLQLGSIAFDMTLE